MPLSLAWRLAVCRGWLLPSTVVVVMVVEVAGGSTAAVVVASMVAAWATTAAVMAAGRMATLATAVTMEVVITGDMDTTADTVAATVGMAVMAGMVATDGMDVGAIHTTVTDGVLALAGPIGAGDGDTRMDITVTVPGITLLTLTTPIPTRVVQEWATPVLMGMTILRQRIPRRNPELTQQGPGGRRPALRTRITHLHRMMALLLRARRFSPLTA